MQHENIDYRLAQLNKLNPAGGQKDHFGSIQITDGDNKTHYINISNLEFEQIKKILTT